MTNPRPVTPEETQRILSAARNGQNIVALQRDFRRAATTIKKILSEHGLLPQDACAGLIPTSGAARRLGISLNAMTRLVRGAGIKPAETNRQGGWYFEPGQIDALAQSAEYKAVINHRLHKKRARSAKARVRVKFPYQPDALTRCVVCRNLCPGRKCAERGITLSRLSVRSTYHQCQFFSGKGDNE